MSKKKHKKLLKKLKRERLLALQRQTGISPQAAVSVSGAPSPTVPTATVPEIAPTPKESPYHPERKFPSAPSGPPPANRSAAHPTVPHDKTSSRREIKKILVIYGILLAAVIVLYLIALKTNLMTVLGEFVARLLHLI